MEAASIPGTPAAVEPAQPQEPAEPAAQPAAPQAPATPAEPGGDGGDLAAQFAEMDKRVAAAEQTLQEQQPEDPAGLADALTYGPEDPSELDPGQRPAEDPNLGAPEPDPAAEQAQVDELDSYVDGRVNSVVGPILREREGEKLTALEKKYPDILEPQIIDKIGGALDSLVQRYGDEAIRTDPELIERVYKSVKAEQADAGAVPAEQAATHGASIEAPAGQSQAGEPSVEEQYTNALASTAAGGDEFT